MTSALSPGPRLDDSGPAPAPGAGAGVRAQRFLLLLAVFVCAACGLVYELALVTLGSYLLGSSITQTSIVIAVTMFAMGVGAVLAKPLLNRPLRSFVAVEIGLGVVGGFSVPALYAAFSWLHVYTPAMIVVSFAVGALVGAEIPLLMALLQRQRAQDAARAIADINAVDYVGALAGGLLFPFWLLPQLGLLEGTLFVAALNVAAAWMVAVAFTRGRRRERGLATGVCVVVLATLVVMGTRAAEFEASAQQALFRDPIVHSERSAYQSIVMTRGSVSGPGRADLRMFLDGDLQFSSIDEYRYHEMLVHPALSGPRSRVLVLGGGDGLALREVVRTPGVEEVTLVDLDPAVVDLAQDYPPLRELNADAWSDERVRHVAADAFTWVRDQADSMTASSGAPAAWDAIIVDFPDPDSTALSKLYSVELYRMLGGLLAQDGRMVIQSGSPFFAPDAFWCVEATVREAGLSTVPYHADVPSFGDWGFVLATRPGAGTPVLRLAEDAPRTRFVSEEVLAAATVFPADRARRDVEASTLLDPKILQYSESGWVGY